MPPVPISKSNQRLTRLRMIKDLKYGKPHLRQNLIDISEISDIDKIFKNRKHQYAIEDQDIKILKDKKEESQEEEINILISPIQRIEMYRKQKMSKNLNQKINKTEAVESSIKIKVPKTTKMLQKFQQKYRSEVPISLKEQLRESQINLQRIKRNDKTKFQSNQNHDKSCYSASTIKSRQVSSDKKLRTPRKKFLSLKTSLPEKQKFIYPSIIQIMKGRVKQKMNKHIFDPKFIETSLQNYLNKNLRKIKIKNDKETEQKNLLTTNSYYKSQNQNQHPKTPNKNQSNDLRKTRSSVQRSFTRSQQNSKSMIDTMSNFYRVKHEKNDNFVSMFKNLKYDRPLTSSIRRRNYTVLGKEVLNPIGDYRRMSEQQRMKLRQINFQFYMKLLQNLDGYRQQQIPTTVYIMETVRQILQAEYLFTQKKYRDLASSVSDMKKDAETDKILQAIWDFVASLIHI